MGPFSTPFSKFSSLAYRSWFPKNILTNSERYFIYPTLSLGPLASIIYITIDNAIAAIQNFGQGCYMGKTDIEPAFRLILVHPDVWELLAIFWNGQYYFDKVLPFGLRSAPYIFNQLSDSIEWILLNKCSISFVCHILDDFLIVEPPCPTPPPEYSYLCIQNQRAFSSNSVHGYHTRFRENGGKAPRG